MLRAHVKDGKITRIETDGSDEPQLRACLRGRAYRQRVYSPDRLLYPVRRVGARGDGKFERISWDEALDYATKELLRVRNEVGPAGILYLWGAGDICQVHNCRRIHRVLCGIGGYTKHWGVHSFQGGIFAVQATYGTWRTGNARDDLLNSKLIILWGWNPTATICGTNTAWYLAQAKEKGIKIISLDPRYTDTTALFADKWIPIIPGTDCAMIIAMAYVLIDENLYDKAFLDKYTVGFEKFRDYVMGVEDGVPKTPAWAEKITGIAAGTIAELAREYASIKPAAFMAGIAPGRTAYGEQYHRAAMTLAAMTGNVGIHGGSTAGRCWESAGWYPYKMHYGLSLRAEDGENPVAGQTVPPAKKDVSTSYVPWGVHILDIPELILNGKAPGCKADIRAMVIQNTNALNQNPDINRIIKAFNKLEFILVFEQFMTATAKFADIVLPTNTFMERNDIDFGVGVPYYGAVNKAVEPQGESRSYLEIAKGLAEKMGIEGVDETEEELMKKEADGTEIPDYDGFRRSGVYRFPLNEPYISFKKQIEEGAPFPTTSGKIEIYSQSIADMNDPLLPPIAKYIPTWENRDDPLAKKYPLQLITSHLKRRTHTQFETLPWLREIEKQQLHINSRDAAVRGIKDGDLVRIFNSRGEVIMPACVTERIMPGVVDMPQGAWYRPDKNGVDRGGNPNMLNKDQASPGGSFPYNTCLVQVEKAE